VNVRIYEEEMGRLSFLIKSSNCNITRAVDKGLIFCSVE